MKAYEKKNDKSMGENVIVTSENYMIPNHYQNLASSQNERNHKPNHALTTSQEHHSNPYPSKTHYTHHKRNSSWSLKRLKADKVMWMTPSKQFPIAVPTRPNSTNLGGVKTSLKKRKSSNKRKKLENLPQNPLRTDWLIDFSRAMS